MITPRSSRVNRLRSCRAAAISGGSNAFLGLTRQRVFRTHQAMQRKAVEILGVDYPGLFAPAPAPPWQRAAQTAARARWAQRTPFHVPTGTQALLAQLMAPWND